MLVAQISDTHLLTEGPAARGRISTLRRAVAYLTSLDRQPDLLIHTGDVAHNGTLAEYALARELLAPIEAPLLVVPGNRDQRDTLRAAFAVEAPADPASPFIQYACRLGDVEIVAADTRHETRSLGDYCETRLEQLTAMLRATEGRPTIVILHHPPVEIPVQLDPMQFVDPVAGHRLGEAIARFPQVIGVLAGHTHRSDCLPLGATYVSTLPSLAVDLRRGPAPDVTGGAPIVQLHDVTPYGLISRSIVVR